MELLTDLATVVFDLVYLIISPPLMFIIYMILDPSCLIVLGLAVLGVALISPAEMNMWTEVVHDTWEFFLWAAKDCTAGFFLLVKEVAMLILRLLNIKLIALR